jgi:hypothetical protein
MQNAECKMQNAKCKKAEARVQRRSFARSLAFAF